MTPLLRPTLALLGACLLSNCAHVPASPTAPEPVVGHRADFPNAEVTPPPAFVATGESAPSARRDSPSASPSPGDGDWRQGDVIAFEAPQRPGASDRDIFIYQARVDTVIAVTAANSPADEANPKLSSDRKWLAFRRTTTGPDQVARADLLLLDTVGQRLNTLPNLNTLAFDEIEPDLSGDAHWLAYVSDRGDVTRLGLYDVTTGANYALPGADRGFVEVHNPRLFDKDRRIAFSARVAAPDGQAGTLDIHVYDLATGSLWRPPFINSLFDEDNPDVSDDGTRMLFDSNRFGSLDLFEANLETGVTNHLSFANTDEFDERSPRYYGKDDAWIRFKLTPDPIGDPNGFLLRVYHPTEALVDTLSIPNQLLITPAPWP